MHLPPFVSSALTLLYGSIWMPHSNMSLGTDSPSDGDDPLSRAANAAADAGLVVVVSAGNTGPDKRTVGAPGAASAAISMAAAQT